MHLQGRTALVTGGGRGIGRQVALDLARAGADVAVSARSQDEVEKVAAEVRGLGRRAAAVKADVARAEEVGHLFAAVREALGPVDVLVTGAGVAPSAPVARTSEEQWRAALETNLSGTFYCFREALSPMLERRWGRVIAVASVAGKAGAPYIGAYAASKHGVLGLVKCAALEAATSGVTVNAVCPGYVDTPMTDLSVTRMVEKTGRAAEEMRRYIENMSPQKRIFTVEEVSSLVLYLCGEGARGITGQALSLDGGMTQ